MGYGKRNEIVIDPLKYNIGLIGEGGIGKTTIIYQMCEKLAGPDGYLFVECGREDGQAAIAGIQSISCPCWRMDYDDLTNSVGFEELIDDIVENKRTEYPELKTVVIDTYDQLREITIPEIVRMYNREHPDKKTNSIKAVYGGYNAGEDLVDETILEKLWSLKSVGVNFIIIGHVKSRNITDPVTGETYTKLSTDMPMSSFNKIKTKLHFLGVAHIDREVVKEKRNKKDVSVVKKEVRKITFRDDDYAIDSKSRFAEIVDEIPFDVDELIKALTDAIAAEANKGSKSISELKKEQDAIQKKIEERAVEVGEKIKNEKVDDVKNAELAQEIVDLYSSATKEIKAKVKETIKAAGISKMSALEELPTKQLEEIKAMFD